MSAFKQVRKLSAALALIAGAAYVCTVKLCARQMAKDDLSWLKREFRLSDAEVQRVRQLHEGYLPKCREMCGKIAAKQSDGMAAMRNQKQRATPMKPDSIDERRRWQRSRG